MIKPSLALVFVASLGSAGCPAHTDFKQTLKDFGINELNCGKSAVTNELPTVTTAVGTLLSANTPDSQSLLDALFRQAPELIACTVKNIVNAVAHPVVGQRSLYAEHENTVIHNANAALDRWGVK